MVLVRPRLVRALTLVVSLLTLPACLSSVESDVTITPSVKDDAVYQDALKKSTRERTIYKDFETVAIVHATYLSPEFRAAFADRLNRVFKRGEVQFDEAKDRAAFFVSVEVPGIWFDRNDLADTHLWSVMMETEQGPVKPVVIKRIRDKERWRPFFSHLTEWSGEFLVIFDTPSINANSDQMVVKTPVKLMIANAEAQLNLVW
ncbi:MAG: hypothetical protein FJ146_06280 [Deltaproteobacteria bacterium]|nr:hypothetical protein [Deltaproteobacteria bacterium]